MSKGKPTIEQLWERVMEYRITDSQGATRLAFKNVEIVPSGRLFHYTHHPDKVRAFGKLKGVPIDSDFFRTQVTSISREATDPDGVVFFHDTFKRCCFGGWMPEQYFDTEKLCYVSRHKLEILEIEFPSAVRAFHTGDGETNVMAIASDCVITRYTGKTGQEIFRDEPRHS